jgi:hypothetical protein
MITKAKPTNVNARKSNCANKKVRAPPSCASWDSSPEPAYRARFASALWATASRRAYLAS